MTIGVNDNPYNIETWSEGYVSCDGRGDLVLQPERNAGRQINVKQLIRQIEQTGLRLPTLVRCKDILHDRVNCLVDAFNQVSRELKYQGRYRVVYPIKVNQQRRVVEEIIRAEPARSQGQVGLEAGSKPELLAVLALALEPGSVIVCNGYKDREFVRMALMGQALGYVVYIVVEKLSELDLILDEAESLGITPNIGIRARLSSIGKGNWQNTGGEKSKFGLSSSQMVQAIDLLKAKNQLECLTLLHFHLGSQIANIRDIHRGFQECARIYSQLSVLGATIRTVDIGGGLGVDYEGTQSRNACSMNYRLEDYARNVLQAFKEECLRNNLPEPDLISESGRALTAHHAILITDVIASEVVTDHAKLHIDADATSALRHLHDDLALLKQKSATRSLIEIYHDATQSVEDIQLQFVHGDIGLSEKSLAEQYYQQICKALSERLNPARRDHSEVIDVLNEKLAEKLFVNFSLFQSLPDIWGIEQIFPILPVENLNNEKPRRALIRDITCDSDGRIDHYVSESGLETTLALPESSSQREHLCFFMVGAYQEILGDMHNLFGDTDSVDVSLDSQGDIVLEHAIRGDTISRVLQTVNLAPDYLMKNYRELLDKQSCSEEQQEQFLRAFEHGLESYTYLNVQHK